MVLDAHKGSISVLFTLVVAAVIPSLVFVLSGVNSLCCSLFRYICISILIKLSFDCYAHPTVTGSNSIEPIQETENLPGRNAQISHCDSLPFVAVFGCEVDAPLCDRSHHPENLSFFLVFHCFLVIVPSDFNWRQFSIRLSFASSINKGKGKV